MGNPHLEIFHRVVSCVWAARARVGELVLTVRFTTRAEAFLIEITLKYLFCFSLSLATEKCTLEVCAGAGRGVPRAGGILSDSSFLFQFRPVKYRDFRAYL